MLVTLKSTYMHCTDVLINNIIVTHTILSNHANYTFELWLRPLWSAMYRVAAFFAFSSSNFDVLSTRVAIASPSFKSSNIMYLIICRRYSHQYVGKMGQPLHCKINSHWFDIVRERTNESTIVVYFNSEAHSQENKVIMAINRLHVCSQESCLQKIREHRWIRTLGTLFPQGQHTESTYSLWNLPYIYLSCHHPVTRSN